MAVLMWVNLTWGGRAWVPTRSALVPRRRVMGRRRLCAAGGVKQPEGGGDCGRGGAVAIEGNFAGVHGHAEPDLLAVVTGVVVGEYCPRQRFGCDFDKRCFGDVGWYQDEYRVASIFDVALVPGHPCGAEGVFDNRVQGGACAELVRQRPR